MTNDNSTFDKTRMLGKDPKASASNAKEAMNKDVGRDLHSPTAQSIGSQAGFKGNPLDAPKH